MRDKQLITSLEIKSLLQELGYPVMDYGDYLKTKALFRDGSDINSLTIYWKDNTCIDHVIGEVFDIQELIKRSLHFDSIEKSEEWLKNKKFVLPEFKLTDPVIKQIKKFSKDISDKLIPDYDYFIKSGLTENTCKLFKGGKCFEGTLKDRQCLIVYNSRSDIVGITGRDITNKKKIKWKHLGVKSNWVWPAYLNDKIILEKKSVILVESPRCVLRLWDLGIKNTLCLFGTEISNAIINYLLKRDLDKIFISTNNEPNNKNIGNQASEKIKKRLLKYFDFKTINIVLPPKKDFGECSEQEIKDWYNKGNLINYG